MELYDFIRGVLAWAATIAMLWPANVPLMALAYKVRNGADPIRLSKPEFWTRAAVTALLVGLVTVAMLVVDYVLAVGADLPAGPVHMVVLFAYVPAGAWIVFVFYAMEDLMQSVSLFTIYLCLPALVLYACNSVVPFWEPLLGVAKEWLKAVE